MFTIDGMSKTIIAILGFPSALNCSFAISIAWSKLFDKISFLNLAEPVTFVLSPIFINFVSFLIVNGSSPLSLVKELILGIILGLLASINFENLDYSMSEISLNFFLVLI